MTVNPVIETMLNRKSIRRYAPEAPADDVVEAVVRAGQQAPFAGQFGSVLLSRQRDRNPFQAPLLFTFCVDSHRMEEIMRRRGWKMAMNDLSLLLFGIQDASLMAENMVVAAESLGLGSCFLGGAPYDADKIAARTKEYEVNFANPFKAAERGFIDEVIMPHSSRRRIARAFASLRNKQVGTHWKKHDTIPL